MANPPVADLIAAGKARAMAGASAEAAALLVEALDSAESACDAESASDALDSLAWLAWIELDGERGSYYARKMLDLDVPATSAAAFKLFVRQAAATLQMGDAGKALQIIENAELAGSKTDIDSFIFYLSVKADIYSALGDCVPAVGHARLASEIAAKRPNLYLSWHCLQYLGFTLHAAGELSGALGAYREGEDVARRAGLSWETGMACARTAWVAFLMGRIDEAHALARRAFETRGDQRWMVLNRAWVALEIGIATCDEELIALGARQRHIRDAFNSRDSYTIGPIAAAFAQYFRRSGDPERADELVAKALAELTSPDCAWSLFPIVARYGREAEIQRARLLLARFPQDHQLACAHRFFFHAILANRRGDHIAAESAAAQARVIFEDRQHAYHAAHCRALEGRLTEAHHAFSSMGAVLDAASLGSARVPRGRPRNTYERTRQRGEVFELLLDGLTNRSIAQRLGVSVRTVKNRVAAVYDFNGVSSREELLERAAASREFLV